MKEYIMKQSLLIVIIIECIFALLIFGQALKPRFYYEMSGTEIPYNEGRYSEEGPYIDEGYDYYGYFTSGPMVDIPRGIYDITIEYDTDSYYSEDVRGNYVECFGKNVNIFYQLIHDRMTLAPEFHSRTFTLWASKDIEEFHVMTVFCGRNSLKVKKIIISQTYKSISHDFILLLFWSVLIDGLLWFYLRHKRKPFAKDNIAIVAGLILTVLFTSYPLFNDFLLEGADLDFNLLRIEGIREGILSGQFPVKIHPIQVNGRGFAASVYYGDVFLYFPALLRLAGFTIQNSYKALFMAINILTTIIAYWSFKGIFRNKWAAFLGTFLFVSGSYRIVNLYQRAAVGEYTAMMFFPLLAYGMYKIFTEKTDTREYRMNWLLPVIAYTGMLESHNLSCVIIGIVTIILCIIMYRKVLQKDVFICLAKIVIITVFVNIGFLYPMIQYLMLKACRFSDNVITYSTIQDHGIYISQLFSTFLYGSGAITPKVYNGRGMYVEVSLTPGIILMVGFLVFPIILLCHKDNRWKKLGQIAWVISLITLSFTLVYFPWGEISHYTTFFDNLQFSWRFLGISSLLLTIVVVVIYLYICENYEKSVRQKFFVCCILVTLLANAFMLDQIMWDVVATRFYSESSLKVAGTGTFWHEYAPFGTEINELKNEDFSLSDENVSVTRYEKKYLTIDAHIKNDSEKDEYAEFKLFYFPGYVVDADSTSVYCMKGENGIIRVNIPAGYEGDIRIYFRTPMKWRLCYFISFCSILAIIVVVLRNKNGIMKM